MNNRAVKTSKILLISTIIFTLIVFVSSCKREKDDPFGSFEVYLQTEDSTGNVKSIFAQGEDIYFAVSEYNSSFSHVRFFRETNIPTRKILVYNENGAFVGRLVREDAMETLEYEVHTLEKGMSKTAKNNWLNAYINNSALPVGKYKATYTCNYTLHNRYKDNLDASREDVTYGTEISFEVK